MAKTLGAIVGICMIAILAIFIPAVAQDNPAGLQGDDVEIYVSAGAFITLQGDDIEIYANGSRTANKPLSVMQGDDTEVFIISETVGSLQGDDVEIFNLQLGQSTTASLAQSNIESAIVPDLSASLPVANPNILNQLSDVVGSGVPEMSLNEWQTTSVDNSFLLIGGGISSVLLMFAVILIFIGMWTEYKQQ